MVADLYIAWAHYFDIIDNFDQAKQVYQKGLDARAAPLEILQQAYERFQFSVGQRFIRKEEYRQEFLTSMEEQRNAFTSLRSFKRSKVGSIRTGSAVRSNIPGQVRQNQPTSSMSENVPLNVYQGGASQMNEKSQPQQRSTSVVEEIENSMVENHIEPGPWSKPSNRRSVFHNVNQRNSTLKFAILEDADIEQSPIKVPLPPNDGNLAINLPPDFVRKNKPQTPFNVPSFVEDSLPPNVIPCYDMFNLQPNSKVSFCIEELRYYNFCKQRNIVNEFTERQDKLWSIGGSVPVRKPHRFVTMNQPQSDMETERPDITSIPSTEHFVCKLSELYPEGTTTEFSFEELMRKNRPINCNYNEEMDETVCVRGRQSFGVKHIRKSIATGGRKSIMPLANDKGSVTLKNFSVAEDSGSDMEIDDGNEVHHGNNFDVRKPDDIMVTNAKSQINNRQENAIVSVDNGSELRKNLGPMPQAQWSIFNDDEETASNNAEPKSERKEQSKPIVDWSIFKDDEAISPIIVPKTSTTTAESEAKDVFAIPQRPLSGSVSLAEKRALESAMKSTDSETPDLKRTFLEKQLYPIGPQTGAVKKSIRKSSIAENAIQFNQNAGNSIASSSNENTFKSPGLPDALKSHESESTYLDYSLCTQKFNINLAEQMASTPVAIRRPEALTEQIRALDIEQPQLLKLSTIMETTEGSAHTASTKSSTQFSSPEDDLSKQSNVMNRTKFVGSTICPDNDTRNDAPEAFKNKSQPEETVQLPVSSFVNANGVGSSANYSCAVEKTLPMVQMSTFLDGSAVIQNKSVATTTKVVSSQNHALGSSTHHQQTSNDGQFQMQSLWIKDEPKSYTLDDTAAEESFAIPNIRQTKSSAQTDAPVDDTDIQLPHPTDPLELSAYNQQMDATNTISEPKTITSNDSSTDESFAIPVQTSRTIVGETTFAIPHVRRAESLPKADAGNNSFDQDSSSDSEEEIIEVPDETLIETMPKIVEVKSLAQRNKFDNEMRISISLTEGEIAAFLKTKQNSDVADDDDQPTDFDPECDQSIYFKHNSIYPEPSWIENESEKPLPEELNDYQHEKVNLEESRIFIETKLAEPAINPFDEQLRNAILQELEFIRTLEEDESSQLVNTVPTVTIKRSIPFKDTHFDVLQCIGHGAYGRVYR